MAAIAGKLGELWIQDGTSSAFTTEACSQVSGTTYQIDDAAKRQWDIANTLSVYDDAVLQTSGYTVQWPAGRVVFASAPTTPVTVTGKSFSTVQLGQVTGWRLELNQLILETTVLGASARTYMSPGLVSWSGSFDEFREGTIGQATYAQSNSTLLVVKLYEDEPSDLVWLGLVAVTGFDESVALEELVRDGIAFTGVGDPVYVDDET